MAENPSDSFQVTIGSLTATVNSLKESVDKQDERFDGFQKTLDKIQEKLSEKLEESLKLGTENSYELKTLKIELDELKIKFANMKTEIKDEKDRKNTRWDNVATKVIASIVVAVLLAIFSFYAGEYTKNQEYKTPPNQIHQSVKKV